MRRQKTKKEKAAILGVLIALLSLGSEGYCKEIDKVPFYDHNAKGEYVFQKNIVLPSSGRNDQAIVVHSDGKPGTEVKVTIKGKLTYEAIKDYGQVSGIVYLLGKGKNKIDAVIEKGAVVSTSGDNSDALYIGGSNSTLINKGEISVVKSPGFNKDTTSRFTLYVMGGATATNEKEGIISVSGIGSSAVYTGGDAEVGVDSSNMPLQFRNKGTIKAFGTAHGITGIKNEEQNHTIINEGKIVVTGGGTGVLVPNYKSDNADIIFKNSGTITTEKGDGISFGGRNQKAKKSLVNLEAGSDIKVKGDYAVGVKMEDAPVFSVGNNTVTNTGKESKAFAITRSSLDVKGGVLKVVSKGVGAKGVQIKDKSSFNIDKGTLDISTGSNTTNDQSTTYFGLQVDNSLGKVGKNGTLKITSAKEGNGAVQLVNKSSVANLGKIIIDNTKAISNGISVADSQLVLEGETSIKNSKEGISIHGDSNFSLNDVLCKLEENLIGIKIDGKAKFTKKGKKKLVVSSKRPDSSGIILSPGAKDAEFHGETIINIDNTLGNNQNKTYAIKTESGNSFALKNDSTTEFTLKNLSSGLLVGGMGSKFIMERGSQLRATVEKGAFLTVENAASAYLDGAVTLNSRGVNNKCISANDNTLVDLSNNLSINHQGNAGSVFEPCGGNIILQPLSNTKITMNGDDNNAIYVCDGGNFEASPKSNFDVKVTGNNNQVLFAEDSPAAKRPNSVLLQGSKIQLRGKDSTVAYARGDKSTVTLNAVTVDCSKGNDFYRVEKGGTINLVNMANNDATMGTSSEGTINLENTNWSGEVFHGKDATLVPRLSIINAGDLNINLKDSVFCGKTKVNVAHTGSVTGNLVDANRKININIDKGSVWHIIEDNKLQGTLRNGGLVRFDLPKNEVYKTLELDNYASSTGSISFNTDLANERGDKLILKNSAPNTTSSIEVKDKSLVTGNVVMGEKVLLLVEDISGKSKWQGKALDTGGLWDVIPDLLRGDALGLNNTNWYLHKIIRTPSYRPITVGYGFEADYGMMRNILNDDMLRQRSGALFNGIEEEGVWAKMKSGQGEGRGHSAKYQTYQVGFDKKLDDNSLYGFAVSHSQATNKFDKGEGKNSLTAVSLYTTNYHDSGFYNDLIFHVGKLRSDMDVFGIAKEHFDQQTWCYGASYELGKNFNNKEGWFIEPQGKISYAVLNGQHYTSNKNMDVQAKRIQSLLGKAGFVLGRQIKNGEYYVKAHYLREFKGQGDIHASAMNNYGGLEDITLTRDYKDSWYEVGFGANAQLSKGTYFYGDVVKTFGADIQKKWQGNIGFKFAF